MGLASKILDSTTRSLSKSKKVVAVGALNLCAPFMTLLSDFGPTWPNSTIVTATLTSIVGSIFFMMTYNQLKRMSKSKLKVILLSTGIASVSLMLTYISYYKEYVGEYGESSVVRYTKGKTLSKTGIDYLNENYKGDVSRIDDAIFDNEGKVSVFYVHESIVCKEVIILTLWMLIYSVLAIFSASFLRLNPSVKTISTETLIDNINDDRPAAKRSKPRTTNQ